MKLKKILSGVYYKFKKDSQQQVKSTLCGLDLKTYPGTIRKNTDQDDAWFFHLAKHNNIIFDIGANVGYTALLAMIQNPSRNYLLVDPNPLALQKAQSNLIVNNIGFKASYYCAFVSNANEEKVKFYTLGSGAAGSMHASHAESAAAVNSFQEVQTVTLDYLFQFYDLVPDLVKIDVEGAETLVMEGAIQIADETKCSFFIEMHDVKDLRIELATQKMIEWSKARNYKVWYLKTGEELLDATPVKNRGKYHILLLPSEKEFPSYLANISQGAPLPNSI